MTDQEKAEILEGAKKAFFEAMLDGYAGGENRKSIKTKDDDGYTTITYLTEDGKFKVVDRYCTTPLSDNSAGTTTIFYRMNLIWVVVWWMSYGGSYTKEAIPFLKLVLKQAYEQNLFFAGRGPNHCIEVSLDLEYFNTSAGDFNSFQGCEEILDFETSKNFGFHKYSGMSLL